MTAAETHREAAVCARQQEMYAFTLACYNAGIERIDLHKKMMAQPPWDTGARCCLQYSPRAMSAMQHSLIAPCMHTLWLLLPLLSLLAHGLVLLCSAHPVVPW